MDNKNLIVAVVLSAIILMSFHYLYEKPRLEEFQRQQALMPHIQPVKPGAALHVATAPVALRDRTAILADDARVTIATPELRGSINLKGGRIDDLTLVKYHETVDAASPNITLLSPAGAAAPHMAYYAEIGWLGDAAATPNESTLWHADSMELTPEKPVRLTWDNGHGLLFERTLSVDDKFMFTVADHVKNTGGSDVTLYPFGLIARHGKPRTNDIYIMHEGPMGVFNGTLQEYKYKDLIAKPKISTDSEGGWLGITDKYWLVSLVPPQDEKITGSFVYDRGTETNPEQGTFQTDYRGAAVPLAAGATADQTTHLFAGAKQLRLLDRYEDQYNIPHLDRAIDFGWFYFLTKPFLYLLAWLGQWMGNVGLAILAFTIMLKLATLPLSMKSYRSMAKMKALQPELKKIQERFKDDKAQQGTAMMELYKREKANPMSGCLPNLVQIPIFFALYKVLYVGIEMRHAPFYGWIHDLSAPDPTSVFNLFGLIPDFSLDLILFHLSVPHIGIWPILMGLSMFATQRLSPQPPDKSQAQMFMFMPLIFTFMMGQVAAGLIIYWTWSNLIGLAQQWFILHKVGGVKKAG